MATLGGSQALQFVNGNPAIAIDNSISPCAETTPVPKAGGTWDCSKKRCYLKGPGCNGFVKCVKNSWRTPPHLITRPTSTVNCNYVPVDENQSVESCTPIPGGTCGTWECYQKNCFLKGDGCRGHAKCQRGKWKIKI